MTAIRATFSQYAMVKTRGVLVLHMEVPLEQQAEVFKVLGYPLPGEEVWCGIARLEPSVTIGDTYAAPAVHFDGTKPLVSSPPITASERGKARYTSASDMERARTRAALLPKDARFHAWMTRQPHPYDPMTTIEYEAEQFIRDTCCAGESRKLIAEDETCYQAFLRLETQYLVDTNQMEEPR